jgi:hypothetical protein
VGVSVGIEPHDSQLGVPREQVRDWRRRDRAVPTDRQDPVGVGLLHLSIGGVEVGADGRQIPDSSDRLRIDRQVEDDALAGRRRRDMCRERVRARCESLILAALPEADDEVYVTFERPQGQL